MPKNPDANAANDQETRRRLCDDVIAGLERWHTDSDKRRAKRYYFETTAKIEADESEINGFLQWYVHDFRDAATGRTLMEHHLETHGAQLTPREREILHCAIRIPACSRPKPSKRGAAYTCATSPRATPSSCTTSRRRASWSAGIASSAGSKISMASCASFRMASACRRRCATSSSSSSTKRPSAKPGWNTCAAAATGSIVRSGA